MIEVGEYVRTKDGIIAKVTDVLNEYCIDCDDDVFDLGNAPMIEIPWEYIEEYIEKHSKNIIDLLQEGDYVNGYKVITINKEAPENCIECIELDRNNSYEYQWISKNDIKTILTKELYEANCYTVERKEEWKK